MTTDQRWSYQYKHSVWKEDGLYWYEVRFRRPAESKTWRVKKRSINGYTSPRVAQDAAVDYIQLMQRLNKLKLKQEKADGPQSYARLG